MLRTLQLCNITNTQLVALFGRRTENMMTDIRITLPDGSRHEVSNTYLMPSVNPDTRTLFNRSQAPSKHEVRAASGRSSRKGYNNKRVMQRASQPPTAPKTQTPRPAGGLPQPPTTVDPKTHRLKGSPFEYTAARELYRRW